MSRKNKDKTTFVALLRGINVGGKNKVDMKLLKKTFEKLGTTSVTTYINSGNVIFRDETHAKAELPALIEKAVKKDFRLDLRVVIRDLSDFEKVIKALPNAWKNNEEMKSDVMFLWDEIDRASIKKELVIRSGVDTVKYVSGAILWRANRKGLTRSGMMKLVGTDIYKQMTVRNVNSTRKIHELMRIARDS